MLKIGEFSRLTQVPAKTLRFYDEIGLFRPSRLDSATGYRYYSVDQLPRLNRILALKGLGLSLEQISRLVKDDLPLEELRGMLRLREAESLQRIEAERQRLASIEAYLKRVEQEAAWSDYDVVAKPVEAVMVVSQRSVVQDIAAIGNAATEMFTGLIASLHRQRVEITGPPIGLYHDPEFTDQHIDFEAALPVKDEQVEGETLNRHYLPAVEAMICTVHEGPYTELGRAHVAILHWVAANQCEVGTPGREVYLHSGTDPASFVTEIQYPIVRSGAPDERDR
jgi:DNA-binding transcriptional MerR regulator